MARRLLFSPVMKTNAKSKKLPFARQTLSNLQLGQVTGGGTQPPIPTCCPIGCPK